MVDVPCGNRSFTFLKNPNRFERMDSMGHFLIKLNFFLVYTYVYRNRLYIYNRIYIIYFQKSNRFERMDSIDIIITPINFFGMY